MPRSRAHSGKQRAKHVELEEAAERPVRAQCSDRHMLAWWWWSTVEQAWDREQQFMGESCCTMSVLSLCVRVDETGEYALGTHGPRLGSAAAPWGRYPYMEYVRQQGWSRDPIDAVALMEAGDVWPWPRPPASFRGGLARELPHAGVCLRLRPTGGDRLEVCLLSYSVVGHEMLAMEDGFSFWGPELDWRWSGCSKEKEEAEARRRATGAAKFRAVALEMDLWDLGSCSDAGSSGDDAVDEEDY